MLTLPQTPSLRLDGKRALVTGASSGIGLACAVAVAEAGADVVAIARSADKLSALEEAARAQGLSLTAQTLDVSDTESVAAFIARQEPFDVMVNAAGMGRHGPARDANTDDFDAVMQLNLRGAYFLTQHVGRKLIDAGRAGSLMTISSQMGHVGGIDRSVYCASKFAVEGFTKAMAIEWGPHNIRVNSVCPTFIKTALTAKTFEDPERLAWIMEKIKLGRVGNVEDIMGGVVFLASDAAALITGTSLMIDGGWTAG